MSMNTPSYSGDSPAKISRLGMIVPDDGPLDYELYRLAPWLKRCGLPLEVRLADSPTPAGQTPQHPKLIEKCLHETGSDAALHPCAERLAAENCRAILWACTSGSFVGGYEWARRQAKRIRALTGLPTTSTTLALVEAVHALGSDTVDLFSTYPAFSTERLVATLSEAGIGVAQTITTEPEADDGMAVKAIALDEMRLLETLSGFGAGTRPILVPNTSINTLASIERLETETGRIIITANQASLWHVVHVLNCYESVVGAGALFDLTRVRVIESLPAH